MESNASSSKENIQRDDCSASAVDAKEQDCEKVSKSEKDKTVDAEQPSKLDGEEEAASAAGSSTKEEDESAIEIIRRYMAEKLGLSDAKDKDSKKKILESLTMDGVVQYIKSKPCKNIVVMAGAGISTSAGIPDFRSAGSGLYDNLKQYKLPHPQAIFEINFFQENPEPFYKLAKELFPGTYKPTPAHYFVRLLHEKGILLRHYTQNIDGLEKVAGIPGEKVVEAHGTFYTSHCLTCKKEYLVDWIKDKIFKDEIPHCESCQGLVKPDIVFFGENLPTRFFSLIGEDLSKADLLIIMGSSLVVQPFASLVDRVSSTCPRILINREKAGHKDRIMSLLGMGGGLDLDSDKNYRDVACLGDCDELCRQMVDKLGWAEDYDAMLSSYTSHQEYLRSEVSVTQFLKEDF